MMGNRYIDAARLDGKFICRKCREEIKDKQTAWLVGRTRAIGPLCYECAEKLNIRREEREKRRSNAL